VPFEGFEVGAEPADRPLGGTIVDVQVGDGGQVDLGAVELPDGCPEDLAPLIRVPAGRELKDGAAHDPKLRGLLLGSRLGKGMSTMDFVWIST
jgi:hypothetical protein